MPTDNHCRESAVPTDNRCRAGKTNPGLKDHEAGILTFIPAAALAANHLPAPKIMGRTDVLVGTAITRWDAIIGVREYRAHP